MEGKNFIVKGIAINSNLSIRSDYFTGKNYITEKRALHYIHLHMLYVEFTVRVWAKLRCWVRVGVRIR